MAEIIALLILFLSLIGLALLLWKKIPVLAQMPEVQEGMQKENLFEKIKKRISRLNFDKLIVLKTLSKVRVYILKAEKYIDNHLQKARKKIVKKQEAEKLDKK